MHKTLSAILGRIGSILSPAAAPEPASPGMRLNIPPRTLERLTLIAARTGAETPDQVIKMSLSVFDDITKHLEEGAVFQMIDRRGEVINLDFVDYMPDPGNTPPENPRTRFRAIEGGAGEK